MAELAKTPAGTDPVILKYDRYVTIRSFEQNQDGSYQFGVSAPTLAEAEQMWNGAMYTLRFNVEPRGELSVQAPSLRERVTFAVIDLAKAPGTILTQVQIVALAKQFEDYILGKIEAPIIEPPKTPSAEEQLAHPEETEHAAHMPKESSVGGLGVGSVAGEGGNIERTAT